jgi:putative spermidine/putrescine transport system ATP-binding protein
MAGASIEIRNLSKYYGSFAAVSNLSLRIEPGELVSLLGPSGSGKTTVLSSIAGFVAPSEGQILVDGAPIQHLPPERRNIGLVFQNYALFPHMTVAENVAFPLQMRPVPKSKIAEAVRMALDAVQMGSFSHRFPSQLSGGQQQRTALARALVFNPPVLLLDEPLSALDKKLRESMQIELKRLHAKTATTMIYVTHDQDEALLLSDRVAVMNGGKLEQIAAPAEVYNRPANRFVADFVGQSNFLDATVMRRAGEGMELLTAGGNRIVATAGQQQGATNAKVCLMVRPERVAVGRTADTIPNRYRGTISEKFFLGGSMKLRVLLPGGESVLASCTSAEDLELSHAVGDELSVGWQPGDVLIYPEK